jgi:protein-S-isoprenylcysteine O-methyltransferase Ste14
VQNKIPPPILFLLTGVAMWLLAGSEYAGGIIIPFGLVPAILLAVIGGAVIVTAILQFRRADTTVNPLRLEKSSSLVTGGIFGWTRNPMYLGLLLVLCGWAVWLQSLTNVLLLIAIVLLINRLQIRPEEAALQKLFGENYANYCRKVRRWI